MDKSSRRPSQREWFPDGNGSIQERVIPIAHRDHHYRIRAHRRVELLPGGVDGVGMLLAVGDDVQDLLLPLVAGGDVGAAVLDVGELLGEQVAGRLDRVGGVERPGDRAGDADADLQAVDLDQQVGDLGVGGGVLDLGLGLEQRGQLAAVQQLVGEDLRVQRVAAGVARLDDRLGRRRSEAARRRRRRDRCRSRCG